MNNIMYSFILTTLAGLSTILGYGVIFIKGDKKKILAFSLAFASGVMAVICFTDLLPSSFSYLDDYYVIFRILIMLLFVVLGFFLSSLFERYLPLQFNNNNLFRIGFLTLLGIVVHNIPEGIVTFMVSQVDRDIGLSLAIAISLHNIPEGISIAVPLYYATGNKFKTFLMIFLAGFSELLGGIITFIFLKNIITDAFLGIIFSIIAGLMVNISLFNLLKEGCGYNKKMAFLGFIIGAIIIIIS